MTDQFDAQRFARDFARRLAKLERAQRRTAASPNTLNHAAIDGGRLEVKGPDGSRKFHIGTDPTSGVTAPVYEAGPKPAQPEAPELEARESAIHVSLSGQDIHENHAPEDHRRTEIHVSLDEDFEPSPGTQRGGSDNPVDGVTIAVAAGTWWVRIVWVTLSGQRSEPSEPVSVDIAVPVDTTDLEATLATAEQIIADAVAAAQVELDELRDRLDNFQEFDPSDLIAEINRVNDDLATARQEAAGLVADLADRVDDIKIPDVSGFITQAEVDAAATAAETAAKEHADLVAQGAKDDAIAEAETKANAAREAAELAAKNYTDQQDIETLQAAALDAQDRADAAQSAAEAEADRLAKAEAQAAEAEAIRVAAADALSKANAARDDAIASASDDAEAKAQAAREAAEQYAEAEAQAKADAAQAEAIRQAALDATAKADAVRAVAEEAHTRAGTAWDHADAALNRAISAEDNAKTHADNMPKMLGGTGGPVGSAPNGSVWFRRDANNTVTGRWERINGSWVQQEVSGELIDNLEAGKITALHTEFAESVIGKLWTQLAIVDRLIATTAWIGGTMIGEDAVEAKHIVASETLSGKVAEFLKLNVTDLVATGAQVDDAVINKLWVDGLVGLSATLARATIAAPNLWPDPDFEQNVYGSWELVDGGIERDGSESLSVSYVTNSEFFIPIELGTKYRVSADLTLDGPGRGDIWLRDADENKTYIPGSAGGNNKRESGKFEVIYEPAYDHAKYLYIGFGTSGTASSTLLRFENLKVERMTDGSLIVDDTIHTRHLRVTKDMVGEFASFMHLVTDRMDVNSLWADQTWQNAGYFGGTEGDYQTQVDGQGLSVWRQVEGEEQLATRLGPGENALSFFDEDTGQLTGSLSQDGSANLTETSVQSLAVAGRDLTRAPHEYQPGVPLLDSMPRGVWVAGPVDMAGVSEDRHRLGFLELTADVIENRVYRISTNNFLMDTGTAYYGAFRYTLTDDGTQIPTVNSPDLHRWAIASAQATNAQTAGQTMFLAPQTGVLRVLLCVERSGTTPGITFNSARTWAGNIQLWLEDLGTNKHAISRRRFSATGGPDPDFLDDTPGANTYQTEWESTWFQAYRANGDTRRATENYGTSSLPQGVNYRFPGEHWTSLAGFGGSTNSTHTSEQGLTFQAALAGAQIQSVAIEITGAGSLGNDSRFFAQLHWAPHASVPNFYRRQSTRLIGSYRIDPGRTRIVEVPEQYWPLLQTGDLQALGFISYDTSNSMYDGWLAWGEAKPKVTVTYQK